jgi:TrmH family RNA methyltransferase
MAGKVRELEGVHSEEFRMLSALSKEAGRQKYGRYLVEGETMLERALDWGGGLELALGAAGEAGELENRLLERGVDVVRVKRGMLFKILGTSYKTRTRWLGVVKSSWSDVKVVAGRGGAVLVGEAIQDPRNVGVLIRTADAAGADGVVLAGACADALSRASVRSTTGSVLHVPLARTRSGREAVEALRATGMRVVGTSARGERSLWEVALPARTALLVGNETRGLSAESAGACDELVRIPMGGRASSLNVTVAAGVVLMEWARRRALDSGCGVGEDSGEEGLEWRRGG